MGKNKHLLLMNIVSSTKAGTEFQLFDDYDTNFIISNEQMMQFQFYKNIYGNNWKFIAYSRRCDGISPSILFEHKKNIYQYGLAKALSQAVLYANQFAYNGLPVPYYIIITSLDHGLAFVFETKEFMKYINDFKYCFYTPSEGISDFDIDFPNGVEHLIVKKFKFNIKDESSMFEIKKFCTELWNEFKCVKININPMNVVSWARLYYTLAIEKKRTKNDLFSELRNPVGVLSNYINAWKGDELEFKEVQDTLNPEYFRRENGIYYTPSLYVLLMSRSQLRYATKLQISAKMTTIAYIDSCAGSGNLEEGLFNFIREEKTKKNGLFRTNPHIKIVVILTTLEYKEWFTLSRRFESDYKYIDDILIIPSLDEIKNRSDNGQEVYDGNGKVYNGNSLTYDFHDAIKKYYDDENCGIILMENPPYARDNSQVNTSSWKDTDYYKNMSNEKNGYAIRDIYSLFVYRGFNHILRKKTDCYILISPIKYWKSEHLIDKKFISGYAFNRKRFNASSNSLVACILWQNIDTENKQIKLDAYDIDVNKNGENILVNEGTVTIKKLNKPSTFTEFFKKNSKAKGDEILPLCCPGNGDIIPSSVTTSVRNDTDTDNKTLFYAKLSSNSFENNGFHAIAVSCDYVSSTKDGKMKGNEAKIIRKKDFNYFLPLFAASCLPAYESDWKLIGNLFKSVDKIEKFNKDFKSGKLDDFIFRLIVWYGFSSCPKTRSFTYDGKTYINETCFDIVKYDTEKDTVSFPKVRTELQKMFLDYIENKGMQLNEMEKKMFRLYAKICNKIQDETVVEYNPNYTYNVFQIKSDINVMLESDIKVYETNGNEKKEYKYPELHDLLSKKTENTFSYFIKSYYNTYILPTLMHYQLVK